MNTRCAIKADRTQAIILLSLFDVLLKGIMKSFNHVAGKEKGRRTHCTNLYDLLHSRFIDS